MKNILIIICLSQVAWSTIYSQALTQQKKDSIIASIGHNDIWQWGEPLGAVLDVEKYKLIEALPVIEDNYWKNNDFVQYASLRVLQELKSPNFRIIAHATIDSAEIIPKKRRDNVMGVTRMRLRAAYYLIEDGDYSAAQYIFNPEAKSKMLFYEYALSIVLKNAPIYREQCKTALIDLLHTDSLYFHLSDVIAALVDAFGTEMFPELVWVFEHKPNERIEALNYLITLKYPGLISLLQQRLVSHIDTVDNYWYLKILLTEFGSPSVCSFIRTYQKQQADSFESNSIDFLFWNFIPPKPDSSLALSRLIDSLGSYLLQLGSYAWLGDQNYVKELDNHLSNAKKHLEKADSLNCAREIEKFQSKINKEYKEASDKDGRFVTIEGWKFLYYNAQYIIDRLVSPSQRPSETVLLQIDNLKAELKSQNTKKAIGGTILVKGLNLLIDKAKKELQKSDSTKTTVYVGLFQVIVDEAWELTKKLNGKSSIIFVNDEAYIALYYRAKYILEALPEPKINLLEQRQQIMEKDPVLKDLRKEIDRVK